jgi:hypothetical protein
MPKYALTLNGSPGSGTAPTALDELLTQIRQYTEVDTNSDDPDSDKVRSILVQPTEPTGANANDLWVKVNAISSRPLGLYAYTGTAWRALSLTNTGDTNSRPDDAVAGETYFDTDINVMLMYTGSGWVTQDGSPGDIKFVYLKSSYSGAAGYLEAVRLNPGWEAVTDIKGRSLVAVNGSDLDSDYHTAGNQFGTQTHTLDASEIPDHTHDFPIWGNNGSNPGTNVKSTSDTTAPQTDKTTTASSAGGGAHENRPPSYTAYCIRKLGYET